MGAIELSQCPDDKSRILIPVYEDETILIEKVLAELVQLEDQPVEA